MEQPLCPSQGSWSGRPRQSHCPDRLASHRGMRAAGLREDRLGQAGGSRSTASAPEVGRHKGVEHLEPLCVAGWERKRDQLLWEIVCW